MARKPISLNIVIEHAKTHDKFSPSDVKGLFGRQAAGTCRELLKRGDLVLVKKATLGRMASAPVYRLKK